MMGSKLLRELFALFSEQNPYIQTKKQPFWDALAPIKNILEQSPNPEWNALAKRLETAPSKVSGNVEYFIYPISGSKDIYLRKTILNDLQQVCEELRQDCLKCLKDNPPNDQWNKALDTLLNVSELLKTGKQAGQQQKSEKSPRYPAQSLTYNPL